MDTSRTGQPLELLALCETLKGNADEVTAAILDHWSSIGESEPWNALPESLDFDHLPDLIRRLAGAALCTDFDRGLCRQVVTTSAAHGEHRAGQGMNDTLVYREYHLLRRAVWRRMKADHGETATVYYATMRIDALIGLANAAALHGLNRAELEESGRWPDALDELLDEWPLPST